MRKITNEAFHNAVEEIKKAIRTNAIMCTEDGWDYYLTKDAPESFKELKKYKDDKVLPIASYGSDTSIYGFDSNTMFRFWHDVTHLKLDVGFSKDGEYKVFDEQFKACEGTLSSLALEIFKLDTYGQTDYYEYHKDFVKNQLDFIWAGLQYGRKKAIRAKL